MDDPECVKANWLRFSHPLSALQRNLIVAAVQFYCLLCSIAEDLKVDLSRTLTRLANGLMVCLTVLSYPPASLL